MKYYLCGLCGNLLEMIDNQGNVPSCCGSPMQALQPGTTDGAIEKHEPICLNYCNIKNDPDVDVLSVQIGSNEHPMTLGHYIQWIEVETTHGVYRKKLNPTNEPKACFYLSSEEKIIAIYAYCNLHGLWLCKEKPTKVSKNKCSQEDI